jgi:hypothetical protein
MKLIVLALVTSGWAVCASKTLLGIIQFILKLNLTLLVIALSIKICIDVLKSIKIVIFAVETRDDNSTDRNVNVTS